MIEARLASGLAVNLNLLAVFVLVAENRNFKIAADKAGRSPSAVSAQIKQLEEQLGVALFNRTTRRVELTEYGDFLLDKVKRGLSEISEGLDGIQSRERSRMRVIKLGCSSSLIATALPPILTDFLQSRSDVTVEVQELSMSQMVQPILDGQCTFGLGPVRDGHPDIERIHLMNDPLMALIPSNLHQSRFPSVTFDEICALPLVLPTEQGFTRQIIQETADRRELTLNVRYVSNDFQSLLRMVDTGYGVSLLSALSIQNLRRENLRSVRISGKTLHRPICLIWAKDHKLSRQEVALSNHIRRAARIWAQGVPNVAPVPDH